MRRLFRAAVIAVGLSACTLLTKLDGLSGGSADADAAAPNDAAADGAASGDALVDGSGSPDAGDGEAGPLCGFPGPTQGLLAYYPFEEGAGSTVHDCTANHVDGTFVSNADGGSWVTGQRGGGIVVHAPDGCVDLGVPAQLQPPTMTVAMWININQFPAPGASGYIVGQSLNANVTGWRIGSRTTDGGQVGWQHATGGTVYAFDTPGPAMGTWHHFAMTYKSSDTLEIFVDGTRTVTQGGLPPITFAAVSLRIGCRADDVNYFDGRIDELRIYDRVLAGSEIQTLATP